MRETQRIAINSMAMYLKMILSLFITFFSTRIVLDKLGVTDFGIYNLVAGAISLLGFVNGSMSNTIQRFLAYELGHGDLSRLRKLVSISLLMHFAIGIGLVLVLELLGLIAFDHFFVIDQERIESAKLAYHFMIGVTFLSTISSPLAACIYAHEDIVMFAVIDFVSSVLKLLAALALCYSSNDRLIFYCALMLAIQFLYFAFEMVYCRVKYTECRGVNLFNMNKEIRQEVFPFMGWNMLESCSWLIKNQGIAVLMNTFYGTVVNAAYGIGNQINGQVMYFSSTLLGAIRPQIYKSAGSGNIEKMISLSVTAAKFSFFVMLLFLCPLFFLLDEILVIWLKDVPDYTARICLLLLIISLFNYMSTSINIAIQAYGNVKKYQLVSSLVILICVPIGYVLYSYSTDVYLFLYIMVVVELFSVIMKYWVAADILKLKFLFLFQSILIPCLFVFFASMLFSYLLSALILKEQTFIGSLFFILVDVCMVGNMLYFVGLSQKEKNIVGQLINGILNRFKLKKQNG